MQADANFVSAKNNLARTLELFDKGFIGEIVLPTKKDISYL
jgi:hypothetical protein